MGVEARRSKTAPRKRIRQSDSSNGRPPRTVYQRIVGGESVAYVAACLGRPANDVQNEFLAALEIHRSDKQHETDVELARLDLGLVALGEGVREGDVSAIREWRALSESRRKLLGLDAPAKVAPTDPTGALPYTGLGTDEERAARIVALVELARTRRDGSAADGATEVEAAAGSTDEGSGE